MNLESKSTKLKQIISTYNTAWLLGYLSHLMRNITIVGRVGELSKLLSPQRQLFYLGGLLICSKSTAEDKIQMEDWDEIVEILNEIESGYDEIYLPTSNNVIDEAWIKMRQVSMSTFYSYFYQGELNYEEQKINWINDLYSPMDDILIEKTGLKTSDFIEFYNSLDRVEQNNYCSHTRNYNSLRPDWQKYSNMNIGLPPGVPNFMRDVFDSCSSFCNFKTDPGIIERLQPEEITSTNLSIDKVIKIIKLLSTKRVENSFLYYNGTKPENPLFNKPIVELDNGLYQVFQVKQVIHAIENLLESIMSGDNALLTKLIKVKGKLLEANVISIFKRFFQNDFVVYHDYYIDECEQDILFLWKDYAFIIEAKGYNYRAPMRNPDSAFDKIKADFKASIGYGYCQTKRVAQKFKNQEPLVLSDKFGNIIATIDTTQYYDRDFSIIVNLKSFGQIQNDLSMLIDIEDGTSYPWVVKLDDLEVFFLTMLAQKKKPDYFIDYLMMRENLHGKLACTDELEVCGAFLTGILTDEIVEKAKQIVTNPSFATVFDDQYDVGMGFKNEKYLESKKDGRYHF